MNIIELLELRGLNTRAKIKMARHQDKRWDVNELYRQGHLDAYQGFQARAVFDGCQYVVSFLGMEKNRAKFVGVYAVRGRRAKDEVEFHHDVPLYREFAALCKYYYELEQCPGFEDLIDRVVIDWGSATRTWAQHLTDKEVIEILPKGYVKDFPGFLDLELDYDELAKIINNPDAHRIWLTLLSSVNGIYLIVDRLTGQQYVGSAYGKQGIWGRWTEYVRTGGHGGNKELRKPLDTTPDYAYNFRFTILLTLDKSLTRSEVIAREGLWKKKLGSRAFGLNT